jgi:hypothetical protein
VKNSLPKLGHFETSEVAQMYESKKARRFLRRLATKVFDDNIVSQIYSQGG